MSERRGYQDARFGLGCAAENLEVDQEKVTHSYNELTVLDQILNKINKYFVSTETESILRQMWNFKNDLFINQSLHFIKVIKEWGSLISWSYII